MSKIVDKITMEDYEFILTEWKNSNSNLKYVVNVIHKGESIDYDYLETKEEFNNDYTRNYKEYLEEERHGIPLNRVQYVFSLDLKDIDYLAKSLKCKNFHSKIVIELEKLTVGLSIEDYKNYVNNLINKEKEVC